MDCVRRRTARNRSTSARKAATQSASDPCHLPPIGRSQDAHTGDGSVPRRPEREILLRSSELDFRATSAINGSGGNNESNSRQQREDSRQYTSAHIPTRFELRLLHAFVIHSAQRPSN